ncbi:hypothetical protein VTK73DRAFT_2456 [Phialemonium thermophilum]|uniref:Uncharacterized protein n=1 Tax=Phialemonium thermophilum TaxID=223376 RepID=A0ABR3X4D7_9PEZI
MLFCTYCGKQFTRKEHLERHLPSHTNVKPHVCSACKLSFSRRDLLTRHYSTYHEERTVAGLAGGGVPTTPGKTPIACQNCANAKTGCDKRVPCSRCAEKNLPCAARFARRSSKAATRAAAAMRSQSGGQQPGQPTQAQTSTQLPLPPQRQQQSDSHPCQHPHPLPHCRLEQSSPLNHPFIPDSTGAAITGVAAHSMSFGNGVLNVDARHHDCSQEQISSSSPAFISSATVSSGMESSFLPVSQGYIHQDASSPWYNVDCDWNLLNLQVAVQRAQYQLPAILDIGDMSGTSQPMTSSPSTGSVETNDTNVSTTADPGQTAILDPAMTSALPCDSMFYSEIPDLSVDQPYFLHGVEDGVLVLSPDWIGSGRSLSKDGFRRYSLDEPTLEVPGFEEHGFEEL